MSTTDTSELGGVGESPDAKAEEEERYRLKTIALQECYDTVALQSVRLRERIYQVKKQCRRLEVMKRVALNMLHQNTGTYDIPPLEIVDEDPLPSFLESLHKQQHLTAEPPRKKSKRPSRSKTDGKLTPEEEERAKQKICSIIDSVYSETARRMGDVSRRSLRNPNALAPTKTGDTSKGSCNSITSNASDSVSEERNHSVLQTPAGTEKSSNSKTSSELKSICSNERPEDGDQEGNSTASYYVLGTNLKMKNQSALGYEPMLNPEEVMVYKGVEDSNHATYHSMTGTVFDIGITYNTNTEETVTNLSNPTYDASFDGIQPMNYSVDAVDSDQDISRQPMSCGVLQEENTVICDNIAKHTNSTSPSPLSYGENVNPSQVMDYSRNGNSTPSVKFVLKTSKESGNHTPHPTTPLSYDGAISPTGSTNGERISSSGTAREAIETTQQIATRSAFLLRGDHCKQDTCRSTNCGLPLPNFIPYRMIAVENPRPVEVITIDSGDETSSPKQLPKRRRKYKYVVESVLDNVPYTFRQAESDDDETSDKQSTPVESSIRTSN